MRWSVGLSVSPSAEAERLGYDERQINRIVIRMARYFLDRDMRIIFGHDWREDGVMRAVADFAGVVAGRRDTPLDSEESSHGLGTPGVTAARMVNVVPETRDALSSEALEAERDSGGALRVITASDMASKFGERWGSEMKAHGWVMTDGREGELTNLRHCLTIMLSPGCRVCLGGQMEDYEGSEPGVMEEARLALAYKKPLYLMGGFGGAARRFGKSDAEPYWDAENGLSAEEKHELFRTTDVEWALGLISRGIDAQGQRRHAFS